MMECIMVLPLHLLALLGVVYLGTLGSDRNAVVSLDHFAAFVSDATLSGVGHSFGDVDPKLKEFYFPGDEFISLKNAQSPVRPSTKEFLYLSSTCMTGTRGLPVWLEGIRVVSSVILQIPEAENALLKNKTMRSSNDANGGSSALLRNSKYAINRAETAAWDTVASEKFLFGPAPAAVAAGNVSEYTRNTLCEKWSIVSQ